MQIPPAQNVAGGNPGQWTTGLCDCCDDFSSCCLTWCCPCIAFGRSAEIVSRGDTSCCTAGCIYFFLTNFFGLGCLYSCIYRSKLRALYSLPKEPCGDCCVHFWCTSCAICQEYRELKNRGYDPSKGWIANAEKMNKGGSTVPPNVAPGMYR